MFWDGEKLVRSRGKSPDAHWRSKAKRGGSGVPGSAGKVTGWGCDRCIVCGFSTTYSDGKPRICGYGLCGSGYEVFFRAHASLSMGRADAQSRDSCRGQSRKVIPAL